MIPRPTKGLEMLAYLLSMEGKHDRMPSRGGLS